MNKRTTTTHQTGTGEALGDDALGAALGSAIGARADRAVQAPPVSLIAERAAARARVRTARRAVVGVAASVALLAGGTVAYNAAESGPVPVTVATESADPPQDNLPAADTEPTADAASDQNQDAPLPLVFTEQDPALLFPAGFYGVDGIETVGDGRVVARAHGDTGTTLLITEDGRHWTQVPLPEGVSPDTVDVSGPRWLLTSLEFDRPARVFYSDDQGSTWTEVPRGAAQTETTLVDALVSNENMVIILRGEHDQRGLQNHIQQLAAEQGLVPAGTRIGGWAIEGDTLCGFAAEPGSWTGTFGMCGEQPDQPDQPDIAVVGAESTGAGSDPHTFSLELSDEQLEEIAGYRGSRDQIQIYASNGGPLTLTAGYESWYTTATSGPDGFYIAMTTPTDELLIVSPDGGDWTETSIDTRLDETETTTRVDDWLIRRSSQALTVQTLNRLLDPAADHATIPGMHMLSSLDATRAAAVAVGFPAAGSTESPLPQIGVSHDRKAWTWQSPSEAFGTDTDDASIDVGLGDGFVIAHVTSFASNGSDLEAQPPKWFKATVQ